MDAVLLVINVRHCQPTEFRNTKSCVQQDVHALVVSTVMGMFMNEAEELFFPIRIPPYRPTANNSTVATALMMILILFVNSFIIRPLYMSNYSVYPIHHTMHNTPARNVQSYFFNISFSFVSIRYFSATIP